MEQVADLLDESVATEGYVIRPSNCGQGSQDGGDEQDPDELPRRVPADD